MAEFIGLAPAGTTLVEMGGFCSVDEVPAESSDVLPVPLSHCAAKMIFTIKDSTSKAVAVDFMVIVILRLTEGIATSCGGKVLISLV